jgi:tRNA-dihydrouridine synthase
LLSSDPANAGRRTLVRTRSGVFAEAAVLVEQMGRFDWIDINAGCPVPKVVGGGGGRTVEDSGTIVRIVSAVRNAVKLPVSVKTRIGASREQFNIVEVARGIEDAGADALALHARFTVDRHSGPADWDTIARIKAAARGMTVIGNGGVTTPAQAVEFWRDTE